ncbi:MAG: Lrp/AsnC family transcriptional regulator [Desulfuromonadales bacterium]|nr:Lrp/AsnC family transcriptional regulator [Desulfuromonadales bacterium]
MEIQRTIDAIDLQILKILQEKARIPNAEVARQVGMAPSAVLERIRKLEERGVIEGYEVRINPRLVGLPLIAFVRLQVDPATNGRAGMALAALPAVQEVHQVAGDDGYLVKIRVADAAALGRVLHDALAGIPGVQTTRTQVVLTTYKETFGVPLDALSENSAGTAGSPSTED